MEVVIAQAQQQSPIPSLLLMGAIIVVFYFFLTSALFGVESKKHRILFKNAVFHFGWVLKSGFYLCFCVYPKTQGKQWEGICSSY